MTRLISSLSNAEQSIISTCRTAATLCDPPSVSSSPPCRSIYLSRVKMSHESTLCTLVGRQGWIRLAAVAFAGLINTQQASGFLASTAAPTRPTAARELSIFPWTFMPCREVRGSSTLSMMVSTPLSQNEQLLEPPKDETWSVRESLKELSAGIQPSTKAARRFDTLGARTGGIWQTRFCGILPATVSALRLRFVSRFLGRFRNRPLDTYKSNICIRRTVGGCRVKRGVSIDHRCRSPVPRYLCANCQYRPSTINRYSTLRGDRERGNNCYPSSVNLLDSSAATI